MARASSGLSRNVSIRAALFEEINAVGVLFHPLGEKFGGLGEVLLRVFTLLLGSFALGVGQRCWKSLIASAPLAFNTAASFGFSANALSSAARGFLVIARVLQKLVLQHIRVGRLGIRDDHLIDDAFGQLGLAFVQVRRQHRVNQRFIGSLRLAASKASVW